MTRPEGANNLIFYTEGANICIFYPLLRQQFMISIKFPGFLLFHIFAILLHAPNFVAHQLTYCNIATFGDDDVYFCKMVDQCKCCKHYF